MREKLGIPSKIAALALLGVLAGGCASTQDLDAVKSMAQDAQSTAQAAKSTADQASQKADQASQTANEALQQAEANKKAIDETNEKINRMFKKSMYK